jgi:ribosome-binding factor A
MADQRRLNRFAGAIKKALGATIDLKLEDPDKGYITLTRVRVSPDLKIASVYYTVLGDDEQKHKTAAVLKRSSTFLRNELKPSIRARWLPELRFSYDDSIDYAERIDVLLKQIKKDDTRSEEE